jgi:WD40 repeat protein
VSGSGAAVLALQASARADGRSFFCSTADRLITVFSITQAESCTLIHQTQLPARSVALESIPGKVVCGLWQGDICILFEVCNADSQSKEWMFGSYLGNALDACKACPQTTLCSRMQDSLHTICTISAHSRFLSGMQMHSSKPWLLSVAQDGTGAVWDLSNLDEKRVGSAYSFLWNNSMLVGACWLGGMKDKVAVASFSCPMIRLYEAVAN